MRQNFKNPIDSRKNSKEMKAPWDYTQPSYDERTSCYLNAGSHHGVGHKQPVGHHGDPKERVDCLPFGKVNTMRVSEIPKKNLEIEMDQ